MPCFTSMLNAFPMRKKKRTTWHSLLKKQKCWLLWADLYSSVNSKPMRRDGIQSTATFQFLSLLCYYLLWFQPILPLLRLFQALTSLSMTSISALSISPHAQQSGSNREVHHSSRVDERCTNNYNIRKAGAPQFHVLYYKRKKIHYFISTMEGYKKRFIMAILELNRSKISTGFVRMQTPTLEENSVTANQLSHIKDTNQESLYVQSRTWVKRQSI